MRYSVALLSLYFAAPTTARTPSSESAGEDAGGPEAILGGALANAGLGYSGFQRRA